jgi:CelD/BcsL family acetyltransferase involved in cellulose biosynthesis/GNAT superfamily N-acetyltransferase
MIMEKQELDIASPAIRPEDCKLHIFRGLAEVEEVFHHGVLNQWADLMELDPWSTPFQGPQWAMSWYRNYNTFDPLIIALTHDLQLAGIVPLAIEKATGRLAFCGDLMADYKDVVALPGCRRRVLSEFLNVFRSEFKRGIFSFGSTLPESDSVALLTTLAKGAGVRFIMRQFYGWRWLAGESKEDPAKKKSVRYPLNYYRRNGELEGRLVTRREDWDALKDEFYNQHSLRQLYGGRPVSFDSPQKRAFYDDLFGQPCGHFTVLEFNGRLIAAHFGCLWHRVLLWGAPSFDIREKQYSPNLVVLVLGMQNREAWGFPEGVDLTVGGGEMKQRFSTRRVNLPWVDLFGSARDYYPTKLRKFFASKGRQITNSIRQDSWETQLKPSAEKLAYKLGRAREMGFVGSLKRITKASTGLIGERGRGLLFTLTLENLRETEPVLNPGEICSFHENEFRDLLRWRGDSLEISGLIYEKARSIPEFVKKERTLHTVLINGSLAGWGISYLPNEPAELSESGGAIVEFQPRSVSLYDFYTLPEFRGRRIYKALLAHILRLRFGQGSKYAYIGVDAKNVPSRKAIESVGFRLATVNTFYRFLKWKKLNTKRL